MFARYSSKSLNVQYLPAGKSQVKLSEAEAISMNHYAIVEEMVKGCLPYADCPRLFTGKTISEECKQEIAEFKIDRGTNVNKNLPLGLLHLCSPASDIIGDSAYCFKADS